MRILADENVAGETVRALREAGHDVLWASVEAAGDADEELLALASKEKRLILTLDKDFGELAFKTPLSDPPGVILVRIQAGTSKTTTQRLLEVLPTRDDWNRSFSVIEPGRVRSSPFP